MTKHRLPQHQELKSLRAKLTSLLDENPAKAICQARELHLKSPEGIALKAAILVDAGSLAGDKPAVEEGVELFKGLLNKYPGQAEGHYNLGNGLVALASLTPFTNLDWYLATADMRRDARKHYRRALSLQRRGELSSVVLTNLGNSLWKAHRWAEAYDAYSHALQRDASNGVAATGAAKVLLRCIQHGIGDRDILLAVAARHLRVAKQNPRRIAELAGGRATRVLAKLLQSSTPTGQLPDLSRASDYERFVADHRLALSPTIEGLDTSLKRWDSICIETMTEPMGADSGVPPLFAMLNILKSDFLVARHLTYQALSCPMPESGLYFDTLDYATYGVVPSMLCLAQRACLDLLDKLAVAATEFFGIIARKVYFWNRWFTDRKKGQPLSWHPQLRDEIHRGNTAVVAMAELSLDLSEGGGLHLMKDFRNSSTHKFTVLHDLGSEPGRESKYVKHCAVDQFKLHLLESLQLARAAVLYFVEIVAIAEAIKKPHVRNSAPMIVPTHHDVRGDDE